MTAEELGELLGSVAAGWPALGLTVRRGGWYTPNGDDPQQQVQVFHGGSRIGWTQEQRRRPGEREYRAQVWTDHDGLSYGVAHLDGMPADPIGFYQQARDSRA